MAEIDGQNIVTTLRAMAWERAKGELRSMLHTHWPSWDKNGQKVESNFEELDKKVSAFIEDIESNGIHE